MADMRFRALKDVTGRKRCHQSIQRKPFPISGPYAVSHRKAKFRCICDHLDDNGASTTGGFVFQLPDVEMTVYSTSDNVEVQNCVESIFRVGFTISAL
jgi:hypothetical protein